MFFNLSDPPALPPSALLPARLSLYVSSRPLQLLLQLQLPNHEWTSTYIYINIYKKWRQKNACGSMLGCLVTKKAAVPSVAILTFT
jgi:hypothetical protein